MSRTIRNKSRDDKYRDKDSREQGDYWADRRKFKQCGIKRGFESERRALSAAAQTMQNGKSNPAFKPLRPYQCLECKLWHLTTSPPQSQYLLPSKRPRDLC